MCCFSITNCENNGEYNYTLSSPKNKRNKRGLNYEEVLEKALYRALTYIKK